MKPHLALKTVAVGVGVLCLAALAAFGFLLYWVTGPGYYAELKAVRKELERIPHVKIVQLDGVHDLTLEHIIARIHIVGKGDMEFFGLDRSSFRRTKHLRLRSVGPYSIRVGGEGYIGNVESATGRPVRSEFWGGDADIGPEGEFASMLPFEIASVQAAVARYDEICGVIGGWPGESSKRYFRDAKGTDYYYYIETNGVQQSDAHEPPPRASGRARQVPPTLDSLPAPVSSGGR
jgi:hypothetical protein